MHACGARTHTQRHTHTSPIYPKEKLFNIQVESFSQCGGMQTEGEGESYCLVPDETLCQPLIQMVFLFCDRNDEVLGTDLTKMVHKLCE